MITGIATPRTCAALLISCLLASAAPSRAQSSDEAAGEGEAVVEEAEEDPPAAEDAAPEARAVHDPWEGFNRRIFAFNEGLDRYFMEPIAVCWDAVLPDLLQRGIDNFFANISVPRRIVNDLLQWKPRKAGSDLGRFLLNSTFGVAGLFDPAGRAGLPPADEDFGQTLGVWGVSSGPYLVLPLFGPSSPRDTAGLAVDSVVLSPEYYYIPFYVTYSLTATRVINSRSLALESVRAERKAAFDFYAAVRSAYVQFRANQVRDRADEPGEQDEDLYNLEDED